MIKYAERMEAAVLEAFQDSNESIASGTVRIGSPEGLGILLIAPELVKLHAKYPELHVQLIPQPQYPSLVSREVDILISQDPPEKGRYKFAKLTGVDYSLYCSRAYRDSHPPINSLSDLAGHQFIDYIHDGTLSNQFKMLDELTPNPNRVFTSTSILAQREAAVAGLGIVALTPFVGELSDDLVCLFPGQVLVKRTLWIVAPADLLRIKRVRVVWDFIRELIELRPERYIRKK